MHLGLSGRNIAITGSTRGIGKAIAEAFVKEGANVAICARNRDQVYETVENLKKSGSRVWGSPVDVRDSRALQSWVNTAKDHLGGIDILVSNASALVMQNTEKDWESNFQTDVMGAVTSVKAAKPFLEKSAALRGDACVILISSVAAVEADTAGPYGAMKAALIHLTKGLARELAPKRIRVNAVSPGRILFDGGLLHHTQVESPQRYQEILRSVPIGRLGTVEEVADAVVFLASPISKFTTGINLIMDGGSTNRVNY